MLNFVAGLPKSHSLRGRAIVSKQRIAMVRVEATTSTGSSANGLTPAQHLGSGPCFGPEREREVNSVSFAPPTYRQPGTLENGKHGRIVCKHIGLKGR